MTRRLLNGFGICAAALTLTAGIAVAADEALPKAETILDHYIEVTGGKAMYQKRTSEIATGSVEIPAAGIKGTLTRYAAEPDKSYVVIDLEGVGKIERGVVNGVAWEKSAMQGARILSGDEKTSALREAVFNGSLNWRKLYPKVETAGVASVNGEDCYKVVLTPAEGKPETNYYSKKTGFVVKSEVIVTSPLGEVPAEMIASDYKDFAGILSPSKMVQKAAGQELSFTIDNVKANEAIPPEKFDMPADVKALVDKPAAKPAAK